MKNVNIKKCFRAVFAACLLMFACFMVTTSTVDTQAAANGFRKTNGKIYYYQNGKLYKKGWLKLNGTYYYMDKKTGAAKTGWVRNKEGKRYFDTKTGAMYRGWVKSKDGYRYFYKGTGLMATGWTENSQGRRYFDTKSGLMKKGWVKNKEGYRYFSKGSGVMLTGWTKNKEGTRYFDTKTGLMKRGWVKNKEGYRYFAKGTGVMVTGNAKNSEGYRYFNPKNGVMVTGLLRVKTNTYRFYDKKNGVMWTGLKKYGGYYYYCDPKTGYRFQGGLKTISGNSYYFQENGRAATGWFPVGSQKYYFSSKGVMYKNALVQISGKTYGFNAKGVMYANTTVKFGSTTYSFDKNGVATKVNSNYQQTSDGRVKVYDSKHGRYYYLAKEFLTHPGVANNKLSDRDLLAAICDAEANDQGVPGMQGVAMCVLNRTLNKEFPSSIRYVIYDNTYGSYPQYSPVRDGALLRRLNGSFEEKTKAYQAADAALKSFNAYVKNKTPRRVPGFKTKDFNYQYFMTPAAFWAQPLAHNKLIKETYTDPKTKSAHTFFVDWISG